MTQVTPPGWYPDPGQTSDSPATERWWDGSAWTEQTRPLGSGAAWGPPGQPPAAGPYPVLPPGPRRRGLRTGVAVVAAIAVLAGIGGGVYALTKNDGNGGSDAGAQRPGGQNGQGGFGGGRNGGAGGPEGGSGGGSGGSGGSGGGSGGQTPEPGPSGVPQTEDGYATDVSSGISLPVPADWTGQSGMASAVLSTKDTYKCPGDTTQKCQRGGAYSAPARYQGIKSTTAEAAAKEDISKNAQESYGKGYGKITSHTELASRAVTVAGEKGYLVRWKVVTSKGDDGYVESLVLPAPTDPKSLVVVRFGVDAGSKGPQQSVIDDITKGIKVASGAGGAGQNA
ncbi:DUF2510 domain-containing protein [Streptomyces fagopyri]|uniref:DUF2510 domain-containing protein n=1 Tax=Streptomyces fagopyri TaxID=2662397 RepID=A0A5Q0L8Z6_9ACTN|nr:DUF2510 domain-containing protein [Streptomyces fagopyri]QFZ73284.1 DUF2510 domain-containing protein [Streptomyces fagopyri]